MEDPQRTDHVGHDLDHVYAVDGALGGECCVLGGEGEGSGRGKRFDTGHIRSDECHCDHQCECRSLPTCGGGILTCAIQFWIADAVVLWRAWVVCKEAFRKVLLVAYGCLCLTAGASYINLCC